MLDVLLEGGMECELEQHDMQLDRAIQLQQQPVSMLDLQDVGRGHEMCGHMPWSTSAAATYGLGAECMLSKAGAECMLSKVGAEYGGGGFGMSVSMHGEGELGFGPCDAMQAAAAAAGGVGGLPSSRDRRGSMQHLDDVLMWE